MFTWILHSTVLQTQEEKILLHEVAVLLVMASAVAAPLTNDIVKEGPDKEDVNPRISSETFTQDFVDVEDLNRTSSITLGSHSQISGDVDYWIRGNNVESTAVQNSGIDVAQRSTLAAAPPLGSSGVWYVLAMVLPVLSISNNGQYFRCNPSIVITTAELMISHINHICNRIKADIRRLAIDHVARDIIATAMDAVLVIYAIGFLVLSMYQASIIG